MTPTALPAVLSIQDLVEWSGLSEAFWRTRINTDELRAIELGCSIRVLQTDLDSFIERSVKRGPNPLRDARRRVNGPHSSPPPGESNPGIARRVQKIRKELGAKVSPR